MKKILSIALALCMVFSLSTVSFAESNGYSTTVTYNGTGSSEWELNVPITMVAGDSGEVTLEGTWDASTVFNVDADDTVTMGNDINDDTEILDITFNAIEQVGNNYDRISVVEPISVAEMPEVLFGEWKGVFNYYLTVDKAEVIDELEQDAEGNYLVSTASDLFTLSRIVNSGAWIDEEVTVLLTNDIDLENKPFTPIGYTKSDGAEGNHYVVGYVFNGIFDGQGNTIYNLNITANDQATNDNSSAGLFGSLGYGHTRNAEYEKIVIVKNLNIDGATINSTHFAGVIAGTAAGDATNTSQIIDCEVRNATVTSTYYNDDNSGDKAGVIIGHLGSGATISGCTAIDSTVTASRDAGQLTGCGVVANIINSSVENVEVKWNGVGANTNIRNELVGRIFN